MVLCSPWEDIVHLWKQNTEMVSASLFLEAIIDSYKVMCRSMPWCGIQSCGKTNFSIINKKWFQIKIMPRCIQVNLNQIYFSWQIKYLYGDLKIRIKSTFLYLVIEKTIEFGEIMFQMIWKTPITKINQMPTDSL